MSKLVDESVELWQHYVKSGHTKEDALDRLASVLATSLPASELLETLVKVSEEVQHGNTT
jgi:hypothetical protein